MAARAVVVANGVEGVTQALEPAARAVASAYPALATHQYLIWIGSPTARKNPNLFATFALHRFTQPDAKLVIIAPESSHAGLQLMASSHGVAAAVALLGGVDEALRDSLYRCAQALLFPSCCEGFGYPIVEAMRQGCPPVALEDSPARELTGGIVELPNTLSAVSFAASVDRLISLSTSDREVQAARLISRSQKFSARTMAEETLRILRDAVAG
jgi:glycosyltransferase involved in cell wall biosynthesis